MILGEISLYLIAKNLKWSGVYYVEGQEQEL